MPRHVIGDMVVYDLRAHKSSCPVITMPVLLMHLAEEPPDPNKILAALKDIYEHWPLEVPFPEPFAALWIAAKKLQKAGRG